MGTVFKQSQRKYHRISKVDIEAYCCMADIDLEALTADQTLKIMQIAGYERRTDFLVNNGDRFDEQISGLATIYDRISTLIGNDKYELPLDQ